MVAVLGLLGFPFPSKRKMENAHPTGFKRKVTRRGNLRGPEACCHGFKDRPALLRPSPPLSHGDHGPGRRLCKRTPWALILMDRTWKSKVRGPMARLKLSASIGTIQAFWILHAQLAKFKIRVTKVKKLVFLTVLLLQVGSAS